MSLKHSVSHISENQKWIRALSPRHVCIVACIVLFTVSADFCSAQNLRALSPPTKSVQSLIVSATPSTLTLKRLSYKHLWRLANTACAYFRVSSAGELMPEVKITSSGLGHATFAVPVTGNAVGCDSIQAQDVLLSVPNLDKGGTWILIQVPQSAFPQSPGTARGKITAVIANQRETIEIPIGLATPGENDFFKAIMWFGGISAPALLAAVIAYRGYILQKRWDQSSSEESAFQKYLVDHIIELNSVFGDFYPVLCKKLPGEPIVWTRELSDKLQLHGWDKIPQKRRGALQKALASQDPAKSAKQLAKIYSQWRVLIIAPFKKE